MSAARESALAKSWLADWMAAHPPKTQGTTRMNTTADQELRLTCIRVAASQGHPDPVSRAKEFYAFVTAEDAKTPRQLIDEALERSGVR